MEPGVKVKLSKVTCSLCKRTFNNYFHWHDHMRQEHESVFRKLSDGRTSSSFRQYYTLADEEQNFVEPSSNPQVENAQSPPVTQNGTNVTTSPQNGSNLQQVGKEESLPATEYGTNISISTQNGSNLQEVDKEESLPAMENGTNISTSPQNKALGAAATSQDLNATEQTSFDQKSGTSDSNLSICEGVVTHNRDLNAEASSDPKNEPSTSYPQAEDNPASGLFSLNKESLSPEGETSVPDRGKIPSLREHHESGDSEEPFEFLEKDGERCTVQRPPNPIDPIRKFEVLSAIKNSRVPEKPCVKELFGVCMLPVFDLLTGTTVLKPHTVEVQSSTPYKDQEQWIQEPCESPIDIAERILARLLISKESEKESSANFTVSDEGITVSGEEIDETDVELNVTDWYCSNVIDEEIGEMDQGN